MKENNRRDYRLRSVGEQVIAQIMAGGFCVLVFGDAVISVFHDPHPL